MSSRSNGVTKVRVHPADDRVRRLVGGVLGLPHPPGDVLVVGAFAEHLREQLGSEDQVLRLLGEEFVERSVDRSEFQTHGELLVRRSGTANMLGGGSACPRNPGSSDGADAVVSAAAGSAPPGAGPARCCGSTHRRCRAARPRSPRRRPGRADPPISSTFSEPGTRTSTSTRLSRLRCIMSADPIQATDSPPFSNQNDAAVLQEPPEDRPDLDRSPTARVRRAGGRRCRGSAAAPGRPPARRGTARR